MTRPSAVIIDDEPLLAEFVTHVFEMLGYQARGYSDPREAVRLLPGISPDIVVLDLMMPGMDGIEVIRHIADAGMYRTQLLLMSGYDAALLRSARKVATERQLQVVDVLTKPLRLDQIAERCQTLRPNIATGVQAIAVDQTAADLPQAIADCDVNVLYQPQVDFTSGALTGVEALARWHHPTYGDVSPELFVPYAEDHGLVAELSEQIFGTACRDFRRLIDQGIESSLSVNLSAAYVEDLQLPERLTKTVADLGLEPAQICFELTETAVSKDLADAMDILTRLRLKGFGLALDDFGTGYSSLVQLHRLPFTELKIDKSFVADAPTGPGERAIIESALLLSHRLGMTSVAEGVENRDHFEIMRQMGCDRGQGFYIARPMPINELIAWALERDPAMLA